MRKILFCLVAFLLVMQLATINAYSNTEQAENITIPKEAVFEKKLTIDIGDGIQQVGYSPRVEGIANQGPQSFAVDNDNLYILDTLNKKVLVYNDLKWIKNISISMCSYPRDIIAQDNRIFILDDSGYIFEIDPNGDIQEFLKLPDKLQAYQVNKLSFDSNDNLFLDLGDSAYINQNKDWKSIETDSVEVTGKTAKINKIKNGNIIDISFMEKSGGVNIIGSDKYDNTYVEIIDDVPDSSLVLIESTLRKYDKSGKLISMARIPLEDYYNYPLRFFNVTDDGEVYIMALKDSSVEINKIILGETYSSKMYELKKKANAFSNNIAKEQSISEPLSDPGVPTRTEVQNRANAMINLVWTYNESNRVNPNPSTVEMPWYLQDIINFPSSQVGIPYCWGGFDGIDRSSSPSVWSNFKDAMSKSKFAGNVDVYSSLYYTSGTAGIDCSGFVSAALGFTTKYNTTMLYNTGNFVSTPLRMDYYVDPGIHVLFFYSWADSGMTKLNSKESTIDGTPQATKNYTRTKNWLSTNGYSLKSPW